tara:strand:- start:65 stop:586 length:522 start_codon:yes stop_codon:yes gene_type:complete
MKDNYDLSKLRKKPKRKNSRTKGNNFENKVAKILNDRFNTSDFSRTPGSGAFATTHSLPEHLKIYGDLISPQKFKFVIECKKGYNDQGMHSLLNPKSKVWDWIRHMEVDAALSKKACILLMAQDRKPIIAVLEFNESLVKNLKTYLTIYGEENKYIMLNLSDLLNISDDFFMS